jgi:hypothetical protein
LRIPELIIYLKRNVTKILQSESPLINQSKLLKKKDDEIRKLQEMIDTTEKHRKLELQEREERFRLELKYVQEKRDVAELELKKKEDDVFKLQEAMNSAEKQRKLELQEREERLQLESKREQEKRLAAELELKKKEDEIIKLSSRWLILYTNSVFK